MKHFILTIIVSTVISEIGLLPNSTLAADAPVGTTVSESSDNLLRWEINVKTANKASMWVEYWETSAGILSKRSTPIIDNTTWHPFKLWGLKSRTQYSYQVKKSGGISLSTSSSSGTISSSKSITLPTVVSTTTYESGTFTTSRLPSGFLSATVNGASTHGVSTSNYILTDGVDSSGQGYLFILDSHGNIVWYQAAQTDKDGEPGMFDGYSYRSENASIVAIENKERITEYNLNGSKSLDLDYNELGYYPHHEAFYKNGYYWSLVARPYSSGGKDYIEDGYIKLDSSGNIKKSWFLTDSVTTSNMPVESEFDHTSSYWSSLIPDSIDWAHANSLDINQGSSGEEATVSFRHLSQVFKIDVSSKSVNWIMGERSSGTYNPDGTVSLSSRGLSTDFFKHQHHANWVSNALNPSKPFLSVYDNRNDNETTRLLKFSFNTAKTTATMTRAIDYISPDGTTHHCDHVGSQYELESGNILAVCGPDNIITEFNSSGSAVWEIELGCSTGRCESSQYRAIPITSLDETSAFTFTSGLPITKFP